MKLAFEAQLLLDREKTGIGHMADEMITAIRKIRPDWDLQLNYMSIRECLKREHPAAMETYAAGGFHIKRGFFSATAYKMLWNVLPVPYSLFYGRDADATFFFNYYIPPGVKGRRATIVHDMTYKAFPETVNQKTRLMLEANMKKAVSRADVIFTVSKFSKEEIVKYLDVDPRKIVVFYNGVDLQTYRTDLDPEAVAEAKRRAGLPEDYLLYLGTLEPRKNIERLIGAYAQVKAVRPDLPKLVLAGRKGWMYDTIFARVEALGLAEDVIFTGYVEKEDVPLLMAGAQVFLFPSLYEGFGMPPLEAMACGTPVLTSSVSSLPEVVGDCAVTVDPFSEEAIAEGLLRLTDDEALRRDLSVRGAKRAARFTWEHSAERACRVFEKLCRLPERGE